MSDKGRKIKKLILISNKFFNISPLYTHTHKKKKKNNKIKKGRKHRQANKIKLPVHYQI